MDPIDDISAIIVHHKNFPDVIKTCDSIARNGIDVRSTVVVDNSESRMIGEGLTGALAERFNLVFVTNLGYGNAVNRGIDWLKQNDLLKKYVLVATHEVRPSPNSVSLLRDVLEKDNRVAVAGPTLVSISEQGEYVWSTGGFLSRRLNIPRHFGHGEKLGDVVHLPVQTRDWLDGSFCLYRSDCLSRNMLPEAYFLYLEETDFHSQIRRTDALIVWCPSAIVEQSTNSIPPFWLGRNLQLFQNRHGNELQKIFTVPALIGHRTLRTVLGQLSSQDLLSIVRGWMTALRDPSGLRDFPIGRKTVR